MLRAEGDCLKSQSPLARTVVDMLEESRCAKRSFTAKRTAVGLGWAGICSAPVFHKVGGQDSYSNSQLSRLDFKKIFCVLFSLCAPNFYHALSVLIRFRWEILGW